MRITRWLKSLKQRFVRVRKKFLMSSKTVAYYPLFKKSSDLTSHYYRASWYLPHVRGRLEKVVFPSARHTQVGVRPEYMGSERTESDHLHISGNFFAVWFYILTSPVILTWTGKNSRLLSVLQRLGTHVVDVDTDSLESREYGAYCDLVWRYFTTEDAKIKLNQENYLNMLKYSDDKKLHERGRACVFGTGPSLETAYEFDFSGCVNIVCNSIVQNEGLLNHIKPDFICAGDVISHLGVSKYAEAFREDLVREIIARQIKFVTTANFGYLITLRYPEIKDNCILINQSTEDPIRSLVETFCLPRLDSTLNIHMLPLANTYASKVFILGCDGKTPNRDNEDFWAHATGSQYNDLVESGHKCHPTFDIHRRRTTYNRYKDSTLQSITKSEEEFGKQYFTLKPSYIEGLSHRTIIPDGPIASFHVEGNLDVNVGRPEGLTQYKYGISTVVVDKGELEVSGWILSNTPFRRLELYIDDHKLGSPFTGIRRTDVYSKHPQFGNKFAGFKLIACADKSKKYCRDNIRLKVVFH